MMRHRARYGWVAGVAAVALALSACGDDSSSGESGPSDGSGSSTGIDAATEAVDTLLERPTEIPVTEPLDGEVPADGTVAWLQCSIPDCEILGPPLEEAAGQFGWDLRTIDAGLTPESVKNAWGIVARDLPLAVTASGFPRVVYEDELQTIAAADVPVVQSAIPDTSGDGITAVIEGASTFEAMGVAHADWVLSERGEDANVLLVHSSTFAILENTRDGFETRYEELCPDCELEVMDVEAESFGTDLPAQVVAKLRSNPDINYVVADEGNMLIGLPPAMQAANLDVPVVGQYPSETSAEYLRDGSIVKALIVPMMTDQMWLVADAIARSFTGQSVEQDEEATPLWIATPDTISEMEFPFVLVPDYREQFEALWEPVLG